MSSNVRCGASPSGITLVAVFCVAFVPRLAEAEGPYPKLPGFSDYRASMRNALVDTVNHVRRTDHANLVGPRPPFAYVRHSQLRFHVAERNPVDDALPVSRVMDKVTWTIGKGPGKGMSGTAEVVVTYGDGRDDRRKHACLPWTLSMKGKGQVYDYPSTCRGPCTYGVVGKDGLYRTYPNPAKYKLGEDGVYRNTPIVWERPAPKRRTVLGPLGLGARQLRSIRCLLR